MSFNAMTQGSVYPMLVSIPTTRHHLYTVYKYNNNINNNKKTKHKILFNNLNIFI